MLQQFKDLSSWREDTITIKPRETYTLDFLETTPNMFVVINPNLAVLKVSIGSLPLENHYEFKVEQNTTETLGRPSGTKKLYILNDSDLTVSIRVFSIRDTFNIQILKNLSVNLSDYKIETNTDISGIKEGIHLPTKMDSLQYQKIVDIQDFLSYLVKKGTSNNAVGLYDVKEVLEAIQEKTDLTNVVNLLTDIRANKSVKENITYDNDCDSFTYQATADCIYCFEWLFNDGDNATIYRRRNNVKTALFTLKTDEGFGDIEIELNKNDTLTIETETDNMSMRLKSYIKTT